MKKLFLVTSFILLIGFISPKIAHASCSKSSICLPGKTICYVKTVQYCCDTPQDCVDLNNDPKACSLRGICVPDSWTCQQEFPDATGCIDSKCGSSCKKPTSPTDNSRFCNGVDETGGINTAIGCIKVGSGNELVNTILRLALGVGGGLALALILYGTFIVTTSAGMPDKLKAGGEIITSAIIGLIFILLSIFLVNLIGINILGIPGFLK